MARRDARTLDHRTLEEIRIRAVQQVQAGESPEAVIGALGFSSRSIYSWLAMYRAGGWDALKAKRIPGRPKKLKVQDSAECTGRSRDATRCSWAFLLRCGRARWLRA